jgi:hypothetical protein
MEWESVLRSVTPVLSGLLTLALGIAIYMIRAELRAHVAEAVKPMVERIAALETARAVVDQRLAEIPRQADVQRLEVLLTRAVSELGSVKQDTGRLEQELRHMTRWMMENGGVSRE